jgi:hypothetical protein
MTLQFPNLLIKLIINLLINRNLLLIFNQIFPHRKRNKKLQINHQNNQFWQIKLMKERLAKFKIN